MLSGKDADWLRAGERDLEFWEGILAADWLAVQLSGFWLPPLQLALGC